MRRRRTWQAIAAVAVAAVIAIVAYKVVSGSDGPSTPAGVGADHLASIPVNGATLSAEVVTPPASVKHPPLVVMPASWGQGATEYRPIATDFAAAGYAVVAYAQRGFPASTGAVDFGGPATQADARAVIDWGLAHTKADPRHVGMFGISYGAGISLLAAAADPRIRAVAALSTWTDEGKSYDVNGTPSTGALAALLGSDHATANYGPVVRHLRDVLQHSPKDVGRAVSAVSAPGSPSTRIAQLNRNKPAIMIANAFEDSIFPPYQLVDFFGSLTTPKRLQLAPGDHGGPELPALSGHDDETVDDARAWFDHYLRGAANDIQREGPIILHDVRTGGLRTFSTWPVAGPKGHYPLGPPGQPQTTATVNSTWQATITAGTDSGATSGPPQYFSPNGYQPPAVSVKDIKPGTAFAWDGPTLLNRMAIAGTPAVHLQVASTSRTTTLYFYLYDVDPHGNGRLITMTPYTATRLKANRPTSITVPLQPTAWTAPSADHLAIVVDTVDDRYTSLTTKGARVSVGSTTADKAELIVPGTP